MVNNINIITSLYIDSTNDILCICKNSDNKLQLHCIHCDTIDDDAVQYTVGLISDTHYNDICTSTGDQHTFTDSGNSFNPYEDLDHVLNFYKDKVDFISCAGDISTNNIEHVHAFKERVDDIIPNIPVYTCKGNHDNYAAFNNNTKWLEYTIPQNSPYEITYFATGDKTSFYYFVNDDLYIYFNLDYNGRRAEASSSTLQFYNEDNIKELHRLLDTYRNKRCFIFTHQPFAQKAGNCLFDYGIGHSKEYLLSGKQFALLNEFNNYYKNAIWFSGHTHYQMDLASRDKILNVCNFDILNGDYNYNDYNDFACNIGKQYDREWHTDKLESGWTVHIPSLSRPLRPEHADNYSDYYSAIADPGCESMIMTVYKNKIHIKGIIFADENTTKSNIEQTINYEDRLSDIADYWINLGGNNLNNISSKIYDYFENKIEKFNKQIIYSNADYVNITVN